MSLPFQYGDPHPEGVNWKGEGTAANRRTALNYLQRLDRAHQRFLKGGELSLSGLAWFDCESSNIRHFHDWTFAAMKNRNCGQGTAELCRDLILKGGNILFIRLPASRRIELYLRCLEASRKLDDRSGEGKSLNNFATAYAESGRFDESVRCYEASIEIAKALDDKVSQARGLNNLARTWASVGYARRASRLCKVALAALPQADTTGVKATVLNTLGGAWLMQGKVQRALASHRLALLIGFGILLMKSTSRMTGEVNARRFAFERASQRRV